MTDRIRNAWAVLTGKATICTHPEPANAVCGGVIWNGPIRFVGSHPQFIRFEGATTMATPFRNLTIQ